MKILYDANDHKMKKCQINLLIWITFPICVLQQQQNRLARKQMITSKEIQCECECESERKEKKIWQSGKKKKNRKKM